MNKKIIFTLWLCTKGGKDLLMVFGPKEYGGRYELPYYEGIGQHIHDVLVQFGTVVLA